MPASSSSSLFTGAEREASCYSAVWKASAELSQHMLPVSLLWPVSMARVPSPTCKVTSKWSLDRAVAVVYMALTLLLNALVYSLRKKDVKAPGICSHAINNWYGFSV